MVAALLVGVLLAQNKLVPKDIDGNAVSLSGRPATVLVFLSHECPIANDYQPTLRSLGKKYGDKAKFVGVYVDPRLSKATVLGHVKEYGATYSPVVDTGHRLVAKFGAKVTPEVRVLDRKGVVQYAGRIDDTYPDIGIQRPEARVHDLEDAIAAVIGGKEPAHAKTKAVGCVIPPLSAYGGGP